MHRRGFDFISHVLQRHCDCVSVWLHLRLLLTTSRRAVICIDKCEHLWVISRSTSRRFRLFRLVSLHFFHLWEVSRHKFLRFPVYLTITRFLTNGDHIRSLLRNSVIIGQGCGSCLNRWLGNKRRRRRFFLWLAYLVFFDVLPDIAHELINYLSFQTIRVDCFDQSRSELFGIASHLFVLVLDFDLDPFHLRLQMDDSFNFLFLGSVLDALKHCRYLGELGLHLK